MAVHVKSTLICQDRSGERVKLTDEADRFHFASVQFGSNRNLACLCDECFVVATHDHQSGRIAGPAI